MIYVTHDQSEALVLSDRIIVMFEGVIHQNAGPEDLYRHPATLKVANFIGLINFFDAAVRELGPDAAVVQTSFGTLRCGNYTYDNLKGKDNLKVGVRPESITLTADTPKPGDENVLRGTVAEKIYIGNMFDYRIRVSEQGDMARIQTTPAVDLPVGGACTLSFSAADTILLPE